MRVEDQARRPSARRLQPVRSARSHCGEVWRRRGHDPPGTRRLFIQITRRPARGPGPDRTGWTPSSYEPAGRSAAPVGAGRPLPPAPSLQAPQPTKAAWLLTVMESANSARRSIAIKQSPWVLRLGRRVGVVVGHPGWPLPPPRTAAPARLAAWSIGRAPHAGHPRPTDRGLETAPDARPLSYLWVRNTVNTVVTR